MFIRKAEASDVDEVVSLIYLAIKDIAYQLTGEQQLEKVINQLKRFYLAENNRFSANLVQVKVVDNQVVGMILCYEGNEATSLYRQVLDYLRDEKQQLNAEIDVEADDEDYYIDAIAVFPHYQGQGIAKQLIVAAEQYAKQQGYNTIALNVDQLNEQALQLYTRLGYDIKKQRLINSRPYWYMVKAL